MVRDYINATVGFEELGQGLVHKSPKSLMRMFGPAGNPQARNLFEVINFLQEREAIRLEVRIASREPHSCWLAPHAVPQVDLVGLQIGVRRQQFKPFRLVSREGARARDRR